MKKIIISISTAIIIFLLFFKIDILFDKISSFILNFNDYQNILFVLMPFFMLYAAIKNKKEGEKEKSDELNIYQKQFEREIKKEIRKAEKLKSKKVKK